MLDTSFHFAVIFEFSISLSFLDIECCFHFNYLISLGVQEVTTKVSLRLELPTLEVSNLEQKCLPQLFTSLSRRQNYLFQIWTAWYSWRIKNPNEKWWKWTEKKGKWKFDSKDQKPWQYYFWHKKRKKFKSLEMNLKVDTQLNIAHTRH